MLIKISPYGAIVVCELVISMVIKVSLQRCLSIGALQGCLMGRVLPHCLVRMLTPP